MQEVPSCTKRARSKAWFSRIFRSSQRHTPDRTTVPRPNQEIVSAATGTPHLNEPIISETALEEPPVARSNQEAVSAPMRPQSSKKALLETTRPSPNVINVGTVPYANASNFVMNNPTFYNAQVASPDQVASAMKALSERAIEGAEYDSSARDPPPSCHPGTRVELLTKIKTWFYNNKREKAFLWLSGPAGVGKSAVIQTFAESLAESQSLGATLFFSRLNDRKDPQRVIATISFQLATRIPAYRTYITQTITLNPSLLRKGMKEQFRVFIVEPFGNKGIGKGDGLCGILLDGLDECEGVDQQREIICLVSDFVISFPDAPLVWSISSRPEPHIVSTFAGTTVAPGCWSQYVPINSTESCQDVERYLNKNFERMRDEFPHVPRNWPTETQFLKLSNAALGLFIFARTAVRYMEDPNHADPVSRLNLLLPVIDHLDIAVMEEHPFALLDAVYNHILRSIPSTLWPTTKRILGFFLCTRPSSYTGNEISYRLDSRSVMGASIILKVEQHVVYSSLHKLHSVLEIPYADIPHISGVSFLHASFGDYLTDPVRSNGFVIDRGESIEEITRGLVRVSLEAPWDTQWAPYTSQLSRTVGKNFYERLQGDAVTCLFHTITGVLMSGGGRGPPICGEDRSKCLDILCQVDVAVLYRSKHGYYFVKWLFKLWDAFPDELQSRKLVEVVPLQELRIDHLESIYAVSEHPRARQENAHTLHNIVTSVPFEDFKAVFQSPQQPHGSQQALIYGNSLQGRKAFIKHDRAPDSFQRRGCFYCFPYPY